MPHATIAVGNFCKGDYGILNFSTAIYMDFCVGGIFMNTIGVNSLIRKILISFIYCLPEKYYYLPEYEPWVRQQTIVFFSSLYTLMRPADCL